MNSSRFVALCTIGIISFLNNSSLCTNSSYLLPSYHIRARILDDCDKDTAAFSKPLISLPYSIYRLLFFFRSKFSNHNELVSIYCPSYSSFFCKSICPFLNNSLLCMNSPLFVTFRTIGGFQSNISLNDSCKCLFLRISPVRDRKLI